MTGRSLRHESQTTKNAILEIVVHQIGQKMPPDQQTKWADRVSAATSREVDVSLNVVLAVRRFLHWILTDPAINPGIDNPSVREAIKQSADLVLSVTNGGYVHSIDALTAMEALDKSVNVNKIEMSAICSALSARSAVEAATGIISSIPNCLNHAAGSIAWRYRRDLDFGAAEIAAAWSFMAHKLIEFLEAA